MAKIDELEFEQPKQDEVLEKLKRELLSTCTYHWNRDQATKTLDKLIEHVRVHR